MRNGLMMAVAVLLLTAAHAHELKPLPDMASSKVPTARDAETIVTKHVMAHPQDGVSATETIIGKLSFTLGVEMPDFGKKGDRVWQVHRVSFAETTSIIWVNAETKMVRIIYPERKTTAEPGDTPNTHSPSAQGVGGR